MNELDTSEALEFDFPEFLTFLARKNSKKQLETDTINAFTDACKENLREKFKMSSNNQGFLDFDGLNAFFGLNASVSTSEVC
jgi:hypothetical protein